MAFMMLAVLSYPLLAYLLLEAESLRIDQGVETSDAGFPLSNELSAINSPYPIASVYLSLFAHLKLSSGGTTNYSLLVLLELGCRCSH